jgi:hypothetical protein
VVDLSIGIVVAVFVLEMIEERWFSRKVRKDLSIMRRHVHSGRRWDALRGNWQV